MKYIGDMAFLAVATLLIFLWGVSVGKEVRPAKPCCCCCAVQQEGK